MKRNSRAATKPGRSSSSLGCVASLDALAQSLSISRSTAKNLRRDGLSRREQGYSLDEAAELLRRRSLRLAHLKGTSQSAVDAKARKLLADANMAELEYAQAKGEVVSRTKVTSEWNRAVLIVKNRLIGLGRELAPHLTGRGPQEIRSVVDSRIFEILRLLAHTEYYPVETVERDLKQDRGTSPTMEEAHE
jgi:hypothetical protein